MATLYDYLNRRANILRVSGSDIFIQCPSCGTRKMKCSVHIHKGIGNCFRASCDLNGGFHISRLICILERCEWSEAISIAAEYSDEIAKEYQSKSYGTNRSYPRNALPIQELINKAEKTGQGSLYYIAEHAVENLVGKRKLSFDQISRYQIGAGYEDFEISEQQIIRQNLIIIPITFNNEIVSYCGRSIEFMGRQLAPVKHYHAKPVEEYLTTGQILFNCDGAIRYAKSVGYLCIVEDAWSAIKFNCVATLGSNLSDDQIYILANNYHGPIIVLRDNDIGGRKAAQIDIQKLSRYFEDVRNVEPVGIDPDDNITATLEKIQGSRPLNLFHHKLSKLISTA